MLLETIVMSIIIIIATAYTELKALLQEKKTDKIERIELEQQHELNLKIKENEFLKILQKSQERLGYGDYVEFDKTKY